MTKADTIRLVVAFSFISSVFLWHWLGPVHGIFYPNTVLHIFWDEFGNPFAWPLTLCLMVAAALKKRSFSYWIRKDKNAFRAASITLAMAMMLPLPNGLLSIASLLIVIYLIAAFSDLNRSVPQIASTIAGVILLSYAFTMLKLSVFINGSEYDYAIARFDGFLGFDAIREWLVSVAHRSRTQMILAEISYQMIFPIIGMFAIVSYMQGEDEYQTYLSSLFGVYTVGGLLYILIPAWGPFMFNDFSLAAPGWFNEGWRIAEIQKFIAQNSLKIKAGDYIFSTIPAYGFVAAMPSLHVATPAVAFFLSLRQGGLVLAISCVLLLVSAWSAIVTGMHYGVDLIVGLLLALAATKIASHYCSTGLKSTLS